MTMMGKCDVCDTNEPVGVACVPGVPMSVAYCQACLQANAHPWWALVNTTAMCGGLDKMVDEWRFMVEDTCKHLGKSMAEFNADVVKSVEMLNEDMTKGESI